MRRVINKLRLLFSLFRRGELGVVRRQIGQWFYSNSYAFGLSRDLNQPFSGPEAKIPISVRPLEERDVPKLFDVSAPGTSGDGAYYLMNEYNFYKHGIPTCYVAVNEDDEPCYIQWLIGSTHNNAIQAYFKGLFPVLADNEALLEYAYTLERFRGLHIMSAAMAKIAERGPDKNATRILTFVEHDNIPSLKGCRRAGFEPYVVREKRRRFFFFRSIIFRDLSEGPPYPLDPII